VITYGAAPAEAPVIASAAPEADDKPTTTPAFDTGRGPIWAARIRHRRAGLPRAAVDACD
jgi:hypothetical protein